MNKEQRGGHKTQVLNFLSLSLELIYKLLSCLICDCVDRGVLHDTFEARLIKKWDSPLVSPGPNEMACCANTYDKLIHVYGVVSACFGYGNKLWFLIAREHIAHVTHFRRWPTSQDIYYYSSVSAMSEFFRRRCQKKSKQVNRCRSSLKPHQSSAT